MRKIISIALVIFVLLFCCGCGSKIDLEKNTSENLKYAREAVEYIYGCGVSACYSVDEEDRPSGESLDNVLDCYRFKMKNGKSAIIGIHTKYTVIIVIKEENSDNFYHVSVGVSRQYTITDKIYG